jgi:23S rRNA (adenine2030-N6)-methyltransferase
MNYRHVYHAGSHVDVFKHAVLAMLVVHLLRKPTPFVVVDTHSGIGLYDLTAEEAVKTGEAAEGIGRIVGADVPSAAAYLGIVRGLNRAGRLAVYPGSAAIIAALLRPDDRLIACELHPDDFAALRRRFRADRRVNVHHRDGYEAALAFVPPRERRGLVFIDPPFEAADEAARLGDTLIAAYRKWPTGIYAAWYPVKGRSTVAPLFERLDAAGIDDRIVAEFIRYPEDGVRLAGGGLVILNPPWRFQLALAALTAELRAAFAEGGEAGDAVTALSPAAPRG